VDSNEELLAIENPLETGVMAGEIQIVFLLVYMAFQGKIRHLK